MWKIKYLFILLLVISCLKRDKIDNNAFSFDGSKNAMYISGKDDKLAKETLIDFLIPDTLILNKKVRGEIKYFSSLEDSIKTTSNDIRFLLACLDVKPIKMADDELFKRYFNLPCDTLVGHSKSFLDTITKPFYITPTKLGDNYIRGIINDHISLKAYGMYKGTDSASYRVTDAKYCFQFKVYVKNE
ncbi:hypothetical protein [uncultured Aquimarina sp.]|uniref:hypothetical protein n=1 Tax=uncultured Aquimarina sp. TaxID=575652 RepID=UPI002621E30D|nr:hypothetical protein [uncultured Aquimarina sp.]